MQLPWHLAEEDFFKNLPLEKKQFLERSAKRLLAKNGFVFIEDQPARSCFYLEEGSVKISRTTSWGKEPIIFVRKAGELFGLAEVIDGKKRKCDAQALSPCVIYEIKREDFEELISRHYPLCRRVIEILGMRVRYLAEQVENLMVCDVGTRLLKLLVCLAYPKLIQMDSPDEPVLIPISLTQEQIAACTGSCQQTVSEVLKMLQDDGLIRMSKKQIEILKPLDLMNRIVQ